MLQLIVPCLASFVLGFVLALLLEQSERGRQKKLSTLRQIQLQVDSLRRDLDQLLERLPTRPELTVPKR
jgi:Tfp pilus assembly protein PilO